MPQIGEMLVFKVGNHVLLANPASRDWIGIGAVVNVHPGDSDLYDVDFPSGLRTVHGRELMLASTFTYGPPVMKRNVCWPHTIRHLTSIYEGRQLWPRQQG